MTSEFNITIVPQCDELGYQSDWYARIAIIADGTMYDFEDVVLIDKRNESGALVGIDVYQNPDDFSGQHPGEAKYVGTVPLNNINDEAMYNLALASWLINSPEGQGMEADVC